MLQWFRKQLNFSREWREGRVWNHSRGTNATLPKTVCFVRGWKGKFSQNSFLLQMSFPLLCNGQVEEAEVGRRGVGAQHLMGHPSNPPQISSILDSCGEEKRLLRHLPLS